MKEFIKEFEKFEEYNNIITNAKICVLILGATWCGPCKKLAYNLNILLETNTTLKNKININCLKESIIFAKVDVEKFPIFANLYDVKVMPHIVFYKNGKLESDIIIGCEPEKIIAKVMLLSQ